MATEPPKTYRKLMVTKFSNNFREAVETKIVETATPGDNEALVKIRYVGVNASEYVLATGRYDPTAKAPLDIGSESIGTVVAAGKNCQDKFGKPFLVFKMGGAYGEYVMVDQSSLIPIPDMKPEYIPLLISGLTAAIALDKMGEMKAGETVLVTAAAGATGMFAVQWAKQAGCTVLGTCSSDEKADFLRSIGCDRPINYNKEKLGDVLAKEYPKGIDVIYESVGGEMFTTCVDHLAQFGRLILIGMISGYESGGATQAEFGAVPGKLLMKCASLRGFHLRYYIPLASTYIPRLMEMVASGKLHSTVDLGPEGNRFSGVEDIPTAMEYMFAKKNTGKVVVTI